jgi:hypothetical protein
MLEGLGLAPYSSVHEVLNFRPRIESASWGKTKILGVESSNKTGMHFGANR